MFKKCNQHRKHVRKTYNIYLIDDRRTRPKYTNVDFSNTLGMCLPGWEHVPTPEYFAAYHGPPAAI